MMRRLAAVFLLGLTGAAGCLPGLASVMAELNTRVTLTGTARDDVVILKLPTASYTQREADDDGAVQFDIFAPDSPQRGRILLRRGDQLSCSDLTLGAIDETLRRLSLDVADLGGCDDVAVLSADLVALIEQRRVPGCELGPSCLERTAVRRNGVVEVERGDAISVALLDEASVVALFDAATSEALNQLFVDGCADANSADALLVRERTLPGAPQSRVVEELATAGCDPAALTAVQSGFVSARRVASGVTDAGPPPDAGVEDAGSPTNDAGPPPHDAGPADAGREDGGVPFDDAGVPADAGHMQDAGTPDADGGLVDAGPVVYPVCGDGEIEGDETCDEGAANSMVPDAPCRPDCRLPGCGDGVTDSALGEQCDDGAQDDDDGCDSICEMEPDFVCAGSPSVCAPAAASLDLSGCADGECVRSGVLMAHQDSDITLVLLGAGVWDMPTRIDLNQSGSVTIVGAGREQTIVMNSYTGNGETLKLNDDDAEVSVRHLTLSRSNNTSNVVRLQKGELELIDVTVGPSAGGNGLFIEGSGALTARASLVQATGLGLNIKDGAEVRLDGMVVVDNVAGGALLDSSASVEVINSVFARNSGSSFGGVYLKRPPTVFAFNTVVANTSPSDASGVRCESAGTVVEATLLHDNPSGIDDEISDECTLVASAYAASEQGLDDEAPVASCEVIDAASGAFELPAISSCRDALPTSFPLPADAERDAAGRPRPAGDGIDVGAFETP